jgi:dihydroorotate dehydrogenase (NAD+) catalytic subunit
MEPDLSVEIAGIRMRNPVMPASGCFGYGEEMTEFIDISKLGAVVTKGTTLLPREGNEQPRICETRAGMINFIGLQNPGAEAVIEEKIPFLWQFGVPIIVNIAGATEEDYVELARRFDRVEGVAGLEVNISCPNTKRGGIAFGQDPDVASELVTKIREATSLPLIVKLTPNVTDVVSIAASVVLAGADALSLINTFTARARIRGGPKAGEWIEGGLSGPAIMPLALKRVSDLAKANSKHPIIGIGGISDTQDALDFLESGADAVAVGTANFVNSNVMIEIINGLKKHLAEKGCFTLAELRQKTIP